MPRKYYKKRRGRKRPYRKPRTPRYMVSNLTSTPMPNIYKTRLRYVEKASLNPGVGGVAVAIQYGANNLYDPSTTFVGHQPYGWDQLISFYDHAVVLGSRITVQLTNADDTNGGYIAAIALKDDSTVISTDIQTVCESPNVTYKTISNCTSNKSQITLKKNFSPKNFLGRKSPLSDPDLKNSAGSGPNENAFYQIYVAAKDASDPNEMDVLVTISYVVAFIEPKNVGGS